MHLQIHEIAALAGVSVRTLHYYDEIGLLQPAQVDRETGYRFYDETSLERLQEILFYRELDFPLKTISSILSAPQYDKRRALSEQKKLLMLKKQRLEGLIAALDAATKGENQMSFEAFDNSKYEAARAAYAQEAKEKWGNTAAGAEFEQKTTGYSKEQWQDANAGLDSLMEEFARCCQSGNAPEDSAAQALVERWQAFITAHYYQCTKEILAGLGQMYVADQRFQENIDRHGQGTAEFLSAAIACYCK